MVSASNCAGSFSESLGAQNLATLVKAMEST